MSLVLYLPFYANNKSMLWGTDGITQHYTTLESTRKFITTLFSSIFEGDITAPLWDSKVGIGFGTIDNTVFFRPINYIYALFGERHINAFIVFRCFLYLYLSGLSFIVFIKSKEVSDYASTIGSILYTFACFGIYFAPKHTFFLEMTIYLPLLLKGAEDIVYGRKHYLYTIIVFFASMSYFYFLYMISIAMFLYIIALLIYEYRNHGWSIADIGRVMLQGIKYYIIAVLLSAFSLLPSLYDAFHSARASGNTKIPLFWNATYYCDMLRGLIGANQIGQYGFISISSLTCLGFVGMVQKAKDSDRVYFAQLLVCLVVFLVPALSMLFSGFAGTTQRWCFILAFWAAVVTSLGIERIDLRDAKVTKSAIAALCFMIVLHFVISLVQNINVTPQIFTYILSILFIYVIARFTYKRKIVCSVAMLICSLSIICRVYEVYYDNNGAYIKQFENSANIEASYHNIPSDIIDANDNNIFRVDYIRDKTQTDKSYLNYGVRSDLNGLSSYYSLLDMNVSKESLLLGNAQQTTPFLINNYDQRLALNALFSVKYLICKNRQSNRVPFGYELIGEKSSAAAGNMKNKFYVYENKYALPIIYTFDTYMLSDTIAEDEFYERDQLLLHTAVTSKELPIDRFTGDKAATETLLDEESSFVQIQSQTSEDVVITENTITTNKENVSLVLRIPESVEGETGIAFRGVGYEPGGSDESSGQEMPTASQITVRMANKRNGCILLGFNNQYYMGNRDILFNLGCGSTSESVQIVFQHKGKYTFKGISVVSTKYDSYSAAIDARREGTVEDLRMINNGIAAKIRVKRPLLACVSVPYSDGWTVRVNGSHKDILRVNGMFTGFMLEKGENEVYLSYKTPWLMNGVLVSAISALVLVVLRIAIQIVKKHDVSLNMFGKHSKEK